MTDNTPRPEPMSREQVLAVLDSVPSLQTSGPRWAELDRARAAVAALYDAAELALQAMEVISYNKFTLLPSAPSIRKLREALGVEVSNVTALPQTFRAGTEPSDAHS
jgi:hypothetical protein